MWGAPDNYRIKEMKMYSCSPMPFSDFKQSSRVSLFAKLVRPISGSLFRSFVSLRSIEGASARFCHYGKQL